MSASHDVSVPHECARIARCERSARLTARHDYHWRARATGARVEVWAVPQKNLRVRAEEAMCVCARLPFSLWWWPQTARCPFHTAPDGREAWTDADAV